MKLAWATAVLLLGSQGVTSLSIPFTSESDLIERDADPALVDAQFVDLEKRRGGGGGGGRSGGGSSSSSGSSSSGSSGGSSGSSSSSSSSGSSRGGTTSSGSSSSSSNRGGSSSGGSGVSPSLGGGRYDYNPSHGTTYGSSRSGSSGGSWWPWMWNSGSSSTTGAKSPKRKTPKAKTFGNNRYYAGGARSPYTAGSRSASGITPFLLPAAALAFFPGVWLLGAYAYPYGHPYYYQDNTSNRNQSLPVVCLCEENQECGCDDNNNSTYYESLFNGTQPHNTSVARVVNVNGTEKIVINGTLANGTTADDGTTSSSTSGAAPGPLVTLINASGYWVMVAVVAATVWSF